MDLITYVLLLIYTLAFIGMIAWMVQRSNERDRQRSIYYSMLRHPAGKQLADVDKPIRGHEEG